MILHSKTETERDQNDKSRWSSESKLSHSNSSFIFDQPFPFHQTLTAFDINFLFGRRRRREKQSPTSPHGSNFRRFADQTSETVLNRSQSSHVIAQLCTKFDASAFCWCRLMPLSVESRDHAMAFDVVSSMWRALALVAPCIQSDWLMLSAWLENWYSQSSRCVPSRRSTVIARITWCWVCSSEGTLECSSWRLHFRMSDTNGFPECYFNRCLMFPEHSFRHVWQNLELEKDSSISLQFPRVCLCKRQFSTIWT